jgi:DNA adenine methylase
MKEKISPLIKWTGGKFREFEHFKDKIPIFERYVEPFFGGGGVFFNLQTSKPSFINDKSQDLMRFYGQINQQNFKTELNQYAQAWQEITDLSRELWNTHRAYFVHPIGEKEPANTLSKAQLNAFLKNYNTLNSSDFSVFPAKLSEKIIENITSKKRRIDQITRKENRAFSETELFAHFETAIKSGLYLFCRDLLNINVKQAFLTEEKASANWYFVRELCYASMFRFNAKGEFNIPYGGIAYNKKN